MNQILQLQNATIFQEERLVLDDVTLSIAAAEFCYLIGKTGSGKSSLLKTIYGELPLRKGDGTVVGFRLNTLNKKNTPLLRRKLGIVFQDFNLLDDRSVEENLSFVLKATGWKDKNTIRQRIIEVLEEVSLIHKISAMPHQLSGGEQQRIVIARAMLNTPQLLIADEPTGNLDPETADEIMHLFRMLTHKHNSAVLFATHDYRIIEKFPARILRCKDGRIEESAL